ncbi:MAG: DUF1367 family protein [Tagaea sp.]
MSKISLIKTGPTLLAPADVEAAEYLERVPDGAYLHCELTRPRNPGHHRKFFALLQVAFDLWQGTIEPREHRGQQVLPNFDRFRADVTILAGYYRPVVNVKNELRLEPRSISFSSMDQVEFDDLYNRVLDVLVHKVLQGTGATAEELQEAVAQLTEFA